MSRYFFFNRRRRYNAGYTEREDGTKVSVRALSAEEDGKFTAGKFRTVYKVSKKDFDALVMIGVIKTNEWHHTGKSFTKNDFYEWDDDDFITIYNEHKTDVSELCKQVASATWQWREKARTTYVKTYEKFVEGYLYDHKYDDVLKKAVDGLINVQDAISEAGDTIGTSYDRYLMHKEQEEIFKKKARNIIGEETIRNAYNAEWGSRIKENENIEALNADIKAFNIAASGKESILMQLAQFFYEDENMYDIVYEASQKEKSAEFAAQREAERKAEEKAYKERKAAAEKKQNEYLHKCIKAGKAERFDRVEKAPELSCVTLEEMNGKYGWFKAKYEYNLPVYYTGYKFADKRTLNHYIKLGKI